MRPVLTSTLWNRLGALSAPVFIAAISEIWTCELKFRPSIGVSPGGYLFATIFAIWRAEASPRRPIGGGSPANLSFGKAELKRRQGKHAAPGHPDDLHIRDVADVEECLLQAVYTEEYCVGVRWGGNVAPGDINLRAAHRKQVAKRREGEAPAFISPMIRQYLNNAVLRTGGTGGKGGSFRAAMKHLATDGACKQSEAAQMARSSAQSMGRTPAAPSVRNFLRRRVCKR